MNRQFRRAQEKQDKKQEKDKARRRQERRAKVRNLRQARRERGEQKQSKETRPVKAEGDRAPAVAARGRVPGRFSGILAAVTVFFITLQGAAPPEQQEESWYASLVYPGFFLMLGYFATLWFMRRDTGRAPVLAVIGGTLLGISVAVAQVVQGRELDILSNALVIPALVAGALLGRLVFVATPR